MQNGLDTLFNQLTKPRLRSLLDDIYRDVSYNLDEDTFAEAEDLDIVRKRFIRAWEQLVDGYRVCPFSLEVCNEGGIRLIARIH